MPSFLIHWEFVSLVNICWIQEVLESYYAQGTLIIYLRLSLLPVFPPSLHFTEEKVLLFLFYMFSQFCPFQTLSERALAIISSFVYYQSPPFYWLLFCWGRRQENKHPPKYPQECPHTSEALPQEASDIPQLRTNQYKEHEEAGCLGNDQDNSYWMELHPFSVPILNSW